MLLWSICRQDAIYLINRIFSLQERIWHTRHLGKTAIGRFKAVRHHARGQYE